MRILVAAVLTAGFSTAVPAQEVVAKAGMTLLVYLPNATSYVSYTQAIDKLCKPGGYCFIHFWDKREDVARKLPMSERELDRLAASYTFNPKTNFRGFTHNCRAKIKDAPGRCSS